MKKQNFDLPYLCFWRPVDFPHSHGPRRRRPNPQPHQAPGASPEGPDSATTRTADHDAAIDLPPVPTSPAAPRPLDHPRLRRPPIEPTATHGPHPTTKAGATTTSAPAPANGAPPVRTPHDESPNPRGAAPPAKAQILDDGTWTHGRPRRPRHAHSPATPYAIAPPTGLTMKGRDIQVSRDPIRTIPVPRRRLNVVRIAFHTALGCHAPDPRTGHTRHRKSCHALALLPPPAPGQRENKGATVVPPMSSHRGTETTLWGSSPVKQVSS